MYIIYLSIPLSLVLDKSSITEPPGERKEKKRCERRNPLNNKEVTTMGVFAKKKSKHQQGPARDLEQHVRYKRADICMSSSSPPHLIQLVNIQVIFFKASCVAQLVQMTQT